MVLLDQVPTVQREEETGNDPEIAHPPFGCEVSWRATSESTDLIFCQFLSFDSGTLAEGLSLHPETLWPHLYQPPSASTMRRVCDKFICCALECLKCQIWYWRSISRCIEPGSKRQIGQLFVPDVTDGAGKKYRKMFVDSTEIYGLLWREIFQICENIIIWINILIPLLIWLLSRRELCN